MMKNLVEAMRILPEGYLTRLWGEPEYSGWIDEQMSWKQTCYIGDWSFLADLVVEGPEALKLFSDLSVNSFARFDIGQGKHVIQCNENGKVIAEGILMRMDDEEFRCQSIPHWTAYQLQAGRYNATARYDNTFKFQVSGPNSLHVIEKASGESLRDIKFMHFGKIRINGHEVLALRQGMAGELGYELQGPSEYSHEIYSAILKAGQEFGIRRMGGRVAMINHIEASFPTVGFDYLPAIFDQYHKGYREYLKTAYSTFGKGLSLGIAGSFESDDISDWYRSPIELGWAKNIRFDHEFIGCKALETDVTHPGRSLVTLVWNSDDVIDVYASLFQQGDPFHHMEIPRDLRGCMYADQVLKDGKSIGISTSRGYSYFFRQMLSLCTIGVEHSEPGKQVTVVWGNSGERQKEIRATVAPAPYKKDNRRVDVSTLPMYPA